MKGVWDSPPWWLQLLYKTHSVSNLQTIETIKNFNNNYNYVADPHTATGLYVLNELEATFPTISLACAHPAKFSSAIIEATGNKPLMPNKLKNIFDQNEKMIILDNNSQLVKSEIFKLI